MSTDELIVAMIFFVFAGICFLISAFQFAEKGFLFNNAYIYASKEERSDMNKKPYYRQSAIVFCLLGAVFVIPGLSMIFNDKLMFLEFPLIAGTLVYAIISSVLIEKHKR